MKKLLIATRNPGKLKEFRNFLSEILNQAHGIEQSECIQHEKISVLSLEDLKIKEEVEEDGKTYKENSKKKALFYSKISNLPTIADDGGIEIEALEGKPGINSNRWLGSRSSEEAVEFLSEIIKELPKDNRKAFFRDVVTFALPDQRAWTGEGKIEGVLLENKYPKIVRGYPYRSFFYLPKIKKYYHEDELTQQEQKLYNHRYKAIKKLKRYLVLSSVY